MKPLQFVLRLSINAGVAICLLTANLAGEAHDAPPAGKAAQKENNAVDDRLFKDLDADLLEGLPVPKAKPAVANENAKPGASDGKLPDDLRSGESAAAEAAADPLQRIGQRMRAVEQRIGRKDLSLDTRQLQSEIVDDLAALIERAKQQQAAGKKKTGNQGRGTQAGAAGGEPTPGAPSDSTDRVEKGQATAPEAAEVKDIFGRHWGHLPEKLREELQNSLSEQFLPKYEKLIEEYYKRLAEERPGSP